MRPDRVWYLAYGSNMSADRFVRYLNGGPPEPGARDSSPPHRWTHARAGLRLCFAGESTRWNGGGVAFAEPSVNAEAHVRAWDLSTEQFEDVFAQENRLPIPQTLDWPALEADGQLIVGSGWYRRILALQVAGLGDQPAVTFTWSQPRPHAPPNEEYLATIRIGILECGVSEDQADAYLEAHA